ncbi:hypothetical protein VaNZ11_012237 [Volvox africanus]|uniref:Ankyrin repeat protein n=1 Tax=Volvox africanus TaxID=51714 RepID=A0ABQ5SFD9_9CHLO|nr:hypothetical protein VaNZ11_012237 [Volvox africanus]
MASSIARPLLTVSNKSIFSVWGSAQPQDGPTPPKFDEAGRLPAGLAAYRGAVDDLDDLVLNEDKMHAEAVDAHLETPLHIAATWGQLGIVRLLVRDHAVNVDPVNWEGWTPFFCAISRSHIEVADFLLSNGANLYHTTPSGMTAMHIAAWFAQRDSIEYLIQKRAPLHTENVYGVTPIGMTRPGPIKRMMFNALEEADKDKD